MKRRLAVLLALTLTFATLSPAGAIAAEVDQTQTTIEDVSVEETAEAEVAEQEEADQENTQEEATVAAAAEEEVVVETVTE